MTTQPRSSRSSSIPIPRSNPPSSVSRERNIESVISLPSSISPAASNLASTGSRMTTPQPPARSATSHWGTLSIPGSTSGRRGVGMSIPGISPTRSTARSFTISSSISPRSQPTFEPRIIRAEGTTGAGNGTAARNVDNACLPSSSTSPTRTRRQSGAGPDGRTPSTSRNSASTSTPQVPITTTQGQTPFPRPAYLAHSALRHLLQTEAPPSLPQRNNNNSSGSDNTTSAGAGSGSSGELHAYLVGNRRTTFSGMVRRGRDNGLSISPPDVESDEDSIVSPPPSQQHRVSSGVSRTGKGRAGEAVGAASLKLPTRWSQEVRHSSLSVSGDGRELTFNGPSSNGDKEAAAARTDHPIPPACGIFYYEVKIVSKGQKGHISIGFAAGDVKLSRLPGWEKNSWGYHGDDGFSFAAEKNGTPYGPKFGTGDVVGCGIDFSQNRVFYTKDGTFLGNVFEKVGTTTAIYPSVGLRHNGEAISVNFGHEPFQYDIDDHVLQTRNQTWATIMNTPLRMEFVTKTPGEAGIKEEEEEFAVDVAAAGKGPINQLVLSYLLHHGYAKTARAFQAQCERRGGFGKDGTNGSVAVAGGSRSRSSRSTIPFPSLAPQAHDDVDMDMDLPSPTKNSSVSLPHTTDTSPIGSTFDGWGSGMLHEDIELRTRIVNSVIEGDIDSALAEAARWYPKVLARDQGLMLFKLRCRKFVELILEAAELKKMMRGGEGMGESKDDGIRVDGMDVEDGHKDQDSLSTNGFHRNGSSSSAIPIKNKRKQSISHPSWTSAAAAQYETALSSAISYGQTLQSDYKMDSRPEVRAIFNRTFGVVAYDDPLEAGGEVAEVAGHESRIMLATELNQDILQSQGRPAHPTLERLYRQTAACIVQLGLLGVGAAAFADMPKEFLDA